jgi:hypothetical protein
VMPPRKQRPELRRAPGGEPEPGGERDAPPVEPGHWTANPPPPANPEPRPPLDFLYLFHHIGPETNTKNTGAVPGALVAVSGTVAVDMPEGVVPTIYRMVNGASGPADGAAGLTGASRT